MLKKLKKKLKVFVKKVFKNESLHENDLSNCKSYSQAGEDKIMEFLFKSMGTKVIRYLEIGTNDPVFGNNTYLFYRQKCSGVCIEANPDLISRIKSKRPRDIVLNVGIAEQDGLSLDFYMFGQMDKSKALSTFSKDEAEHVSRMLNTQIDKVIKIPTMTINKVLEQYFAKEAPDVLSVDAEGIDLQILKSINYDKFRPVLICVETVNFTPDYKKVKDKEILAFMETKNYFVYADSGINTIFMDKMKF